MAFSKFFLKFFESVGTESITCGRTSLIATGMFFRSDTVLLPQGTVAMLPP